MSFYVLENPSAYDTDKFAITDFTDAPPVHDGEAPRCPVCDTYTGAIPWLPPYRAELEVWTNHYGDIAFGPGDELLVSQYFADKYREAGLMGLSGFHGVEIIKVIRRNGARPKKPPPDYFCVRPNRSRAAIDLKSSNIEYEEFPRCEECQLALFKRIHFVAIEDSSWSGEDIFYARGLAGTVFCSERFKKWFEKNRINNGSLIPVEEYRQYFGLGAKDS